MAWTRKEKILTALMLLASGSVFALSQAEYADSSFDRWAKNEHAMNTRAVAGTECNTVIGVKQVPHDAWPSAR
ncbi:hypothetical protein, partial [Pseudomonas sp. A-1]|uniref:hypothetical protein n=1 Tax=Pseudomonas sp. A-1 TaxID=1821274 RepID=UPI001C49A464